MAQMSWLRQKLGGYELVGITNYNDVSWMSEWEIENLQGVPYSKWHYRSRYGRTVQKLVKGHWRQIKKTKSIPVVYEWKIDELPVAELTFSKEIMYDYIDANPDMFDIKFSYETLKSGKKRLTGASIVYRYDKAKTKNKPTISSKLFHG